jgi:hypothetical protein
MNFVFNQAALIEHREAAEWYQARSILAGPRFIQEVETAIQAIVSDPQRYQPIGNGCQVFRLKRSLTRFTSFMIPSSSPFMPSCTNAANPMSGVTDWDSSTHQK